MKKKGNLGDEPVKYQTMSLEEFEEVGFNLEQRQDDEAYGYFREMVYFYEAYYKKSTVVAKNSADDQVAVEYAGYVKQKLLNYLIRYGTFLKMTKQKNEHDAKDTLERALQLDRTNPIGNYRLGFLAYKRQNYSQASDYFQTAIDKQAHDSKSKWLLNPQQLYHAHLYLVNSSLFMAKQTNERLKQLSDANYPVLEQYDMSPFFNVIGENEAYLHQRAFVKRTNGGGEEYCSKQECENILDDERLKDCIILYQSDHEFILRYNDHAETFLPDYARLLKDFLLLSSATNILTAEHLPDHFTSTNVNPNTYSKRIHRLRSLLTDFNIPSVIQTRRGSVTAYFYNESIPFIIMERVEDEMN